MLCINCLFRERGLLWPPDLEQLLAPFPHPAALFILHQHHLMFGLNFDSFGSLCPPAREFRGGALVSSSGDKLIPTFLPNPEGPGKAQGVHLDQQGRTVMVAPGQPLRGSGVWEVLRGQEEDSMRTSQHMLALYHLEEALREIEAQSNLFDGLCRQALWNWILIPTDYMNDLGQGF